MIPTLQYLRLGDLPNLFEQANDIETTPTGAQPASAVGSLRRLRSVRWNVAGRIVWAWILTIPASAAMAMICWLLIDWGRRLF